MVEIWIVWENILLNYIREFYNLILGRLKEVIKMKGNLIKY